MNEAIKLAIEKGGYNGLDLPFDHNVFLVHEWLEYGEHPVDAVVLDPLFWQALGRALGWKFKAYIKGQWNTEEKDLSYLSDTPFREPEWLWQAKRYFELKLTGGDEKTFWKELLK